MYSTARTEQGSTPVIHVAIFATRDEFTTLMTLMNSVVKSTPVRNITFHLVTSGADKQLLKDALEDSPLSNLVYEIIECPAGWTQGRNMIDFAPSRLPDLLPYIGGRVIVLDPYCLVEGDIGDLVETPIIHGHWAAMATLCNSDPTSTMPEERYRNYLNFSHEAIAKLHVLPDTCVPSPAVMVADIMALRFAHARRKMWQWIHLSDNSPVFLKTPDGIVSSKAAFSVVFHNHTSLLNPQWYTRVTEKSSPSRNQHSLYHWVGQGKPWDPSSGVAGLWNAFLVRSSTDGSG